MTPPVAIHQPPSRDLNDDVVAEILLRLPPASVFRCLAVCRAWRAIGGSPGFVAAYDACRRRPLELIVQRHGANGVLDTIPVATLDEGRRRCINPGYPKCTSTGRIMGAYSLRGSCDGLLLFEGDVYHGDDQWICNPVTRQWTAVPPHKSGTMTRCCGFYLHRPSGEHRLLFITNEDGRGTSAAHYVRSLEDGEFRRLGPAAATVELFSQFILEYLDYQGKIHWINHPEVKETDEILVFDTVSETFDGCRARH